MNNAVGARVINDETVERRILDQLAKAPPQGFARWNDKRGPDSRPKLSGWRQKSTKLICKPAKR
jgi:GH24 family phage-related lysozyme (muramidase)